MTCNGMCGSLVEKGHFPISYGYISCVGLRTATISCKPLEPHYSKCGPWTSVSAPPESWSDENSGSHPTSPESGPACQQDPPVILTHCKFWGALLERTPNKSD